jgi:hypothetical protein
MASQEIRKRANIGSSSLIVIFIVLCLVTFSILSLGNANNDTQISERNAQAVQEYYRADALGTEFLGMIDETMKNSADKAAVLSVCGEYYQQDSDLFATDITMKSGQALHIELKPDWQKKDVEVSAWKVYNQEDYEIDQSMKVWSGQS